jgi:hypothetical protein
MSTAAAVPRFARSSARGQALGLADPLPSSLAALLAERSAQHARVVAKLDALREKRVELARKVTEQEAADEEEATRAAMENRNPAKRMRVAKLREQLEATEAEILNFERGLATSADRLLETAAPLAARAADRAGKAQQAALERAGELLDALDGALEEAGSLRAEELWLHRLHGLDGAKPRIEPYTVGSDPGLSRLRRSLQDAWAEWRMRDEDAQAEADRQRAWEEEQRETWERQKERAEQEAAAAKVRYEGMRKTHIGGVPVPGYEEAEEEQR